MAASSAAAVPSSTSPAPNGTATPTSTGAARRCVEREREILKTGKRSIEVTWSLTSLGAERAGPEELLALVRNHWHIENRLHYVRDFTYDEDRCRAYVRHLPRNLACLTNVAIASALSGRFRYLPEAAARAGCPRRDPDRARCMIT